MTTDAPDSIPLTPDQPEPAPAPKRRRYWRFVALICLLLLVATGAAAWFRLERWAQTPFGNKSSVALIIDRGMSTRAICRRLQQNGLIDHDWAFLVWLGAHGRHPQLQAGRYTIDSPITPAGLLGRLSHGNFDRPLTIPEGWTCAQIARRLKEQKMIDDEQIWMQLVARPIPASVLGVEIPQGAEGFCFPETYFIEQGSRPESILARMIERFRRQWQSARPDERDPRARDLSLIQIVTLASMIEREARAPDEMPVMASVYLNRLRKNMRLQCDATVYYALGKNWDERLSLADIEIDHPYNTYRRAGLPPGPISNPSQAAIEAVLHPAANEFLFYVYAGNKHHIFSRTFAEHQAAIRTAQKRLATKP